MSRLAVAAVVAATSLLGLPDTSSARPTKQDLEQAKARLDSLNTRIDILDEQYLQALAALDRVRDRLASARADARRSRAQARAARDDLSERAAAAYEGAGSQLGMLLGSSSLSDFSDRLEFLGSIALDDSEAVTRAQVAGQRAEWSSRELARALDERRQAADALAAKKAEIEGAIDDQRALVAEIEEELSRPIVPPPPENPPDAPTVAAASTEEASADSAVADGSTVEAPSESTISAPPAPSSQVQEVLDAAYSVIGTPYQYAGSSPEEGFDCSGFTMWAWAHGGVSLPHSSADQYATLPHIDQSDLQPGDLVFFYSPIHHVGMYVGGGRMIHAPHTGGYVEVIPIYWEYYVGAARPG